MKSGKGLVRTKWSLSQAWISCNTIAKPVRIIQLFTDSQGVWPRTCCLHSPFVKKTSCSRITTPGLSGCVNVVTTGFPTPSLPACTRGDWHDHIYISNFCEKMAPSCRPPGQYCVSRTCQQVAAKNHDRKPCDRKPNGSHLPEVGIQGLARSSVNQRENHGLTYATRLTDVKNACVLPLS